MFHVKHFCLGKTATFLLMMTSQKESEEKEMKNTKILEMLNNGQIDELKALLQDEIYVDSLKNKGDYKKRYSAMKKYFGYIKTPIKACQKPCEITFEGGTCNSFINEYSLVLTKESTGEIEMFNQQKDGEYFKVERLISYDGTQREIDFTKVLADAKSKGYKLKKSEVGADFKYVLHYDGAYYKLGLLDAAYAIIDNGEKATVYHKDGAETAPITVKNDIGVALVLPVKLAESFFQKDGVVVIEV